jgi:hypothetical protein
MIECTEIFWHHFYKGAGITLSVLIPLALIWGGGMLVIFRQQHRHEVRMQEARLQEEQARTTRYRVLPGGQG